VINEYFDVLLDHVIVLIIDPNDVNLPLEVLVQLPVLFLEPVILLLDL
jgi:hypothetical protein